MSDKITYLRATPWERRNLLMSRMFRKHQEVFPEYNLSTNIATFLVEVLKILPDEAFDCNLESIFQDALVEARRLRCG